MNSSFDVWLLPHRLEHLLSTLPENLATFQGDGHLYCGLHVDSGRIAAQMKKTLREVIEKYNLDVRITPNQNIILTNIRNAWKRPITTALAQSGLLVNYYSLALLGD